MCSEIVNRQDDPASTGGVQEIGEAGAPLDVDVLGAVLERRRQHALPLVFRAAILAAFPRRPAGGDDRKAAARQCASDIEVGDAVEPQLDEIGTDHVVSATPQQVHRRRRHGDAESGSRHGRVLENHINTSSQKKASSTGVAEEAASRRAVIGVRPGRMPLLPGSNTTATPPRTRPSGW